MYTIQINHKKGDLIPYGYSVTNGVTTAEVKTKKSAEEFIKILKKYGKKIAKQ